MATIRFLAGAIVLSLAGCADRPSTFAELGPEANTKGFGDLYPPATAEGEFTFGVGDSVGIMVQNNPDLTGTFTVRMDGRITLNVIGEVVVAGLTPDQVRRKLESKIAVYMKDVAVTVSPMAIVSKKFYVAARSPLTGGFIVRQVPYRGDTTLFEVWAAMGSPSTSTDDDAHVKVIRPDPRHPVIKVVNIREMRLCGYSGGNIQIKPNDIVYVPPTIWGRVSAATAAIAAPFQGLFYLMSTWANLNYFADVITGDDNLRFGGGYGFYGGFGYGGGYGLGTLGTIPQAPPTGTIPAAGPGALPSGG
jgi:polysaccharide export outer membrane protein